MKKIIIIGSLILGMVVVVFGIQALFPSVSEGEKSISFIFENSEEGKMIKEIVVDTDVLTLEEVLLEQDFEAEISSGSFGSFIDGLFGYVTEDMDNGPWWTYSSENNETCVTFGYCPAVNDVAINDGDEFYFTFTKTFD